MTGLTRCRSLLNIKTAITLMACLLFAAASMGCITGDAQAAATKPEAAKGTASAWIAYASLTAAESPAPPPVDPDEDDSGDDDSGAYLKPSKLAAPISFAACKCGDDCDCAAGECGDASCSTASSELALASNGTDCRDGSCRTTGPVRATAKAAKSVVKKTAAAVRDGPRLFGDGDGPLRRLFRRGGCGVFGCR